MRLTRRGWAVVVAVAAGLLMAWWFGARSLNAVVAPGLVALAAGWLQLRRAPDPTVTRSSPAPGFPGERRTVDLSVETALNAEVSEEGGGGLRLVDADRSIAGSAEIQYAFGLVRRGEHALGPAHVTVRDSLGLFAADHTVAGRTSVLVYPDVKPVAAARAFDRLVDESGTPDRQAFERLREYVPGDALRDVHWKSSAKRADDELVVTEFADEDRGGVTVAAEAAAGRADEMAAIAASIALHLLDADVEVDVVCPGGSVQGATGEEGRDLVLDLFARTPGGRVGGDVRASADVTVEATDDGITVVIAGQRHDVAELVDGTSLADGETADAPPGVRA